MHLREMEGSFRIGGVHIYEIIKIWYSVGFYMCSGPITRSLQNGLPFPDFHLALATRFLKSLKLAYLEFLRVLYGVNYDLGRKFRIQGGDGGCRGQSSVNMGQDQEHRQ